MSRWSECAMCGVVFEYAGRGRIPRVCTDHVEEWRRRQSRNRIERWAVRKASELAGQDDHSRNELR